MQGSDRPDPAPRRAATLACALVLLASGFLLGGAGGRFDFLPGHGIPAAVDALVARADAFRPWTWLTSGLIPRDLFHLCRDVFFLLAFGTLLETRLGARALLALLAGGIVATAILAQLWLTGAGPVRIHGAAGGVNLLAGTALVLTPRMGLRVTLPIRFDAHVRSLFGFWILLQAVFLRVQDSPTLAVAQAFGLLPGALAGIAIRRRAGSPSSLPDDPPPWRAAAGLRASDEWIRTHRGTRLIDDWFWLIASLAAWSFAAVFLTLAIGGWNAPHARGTAVTRLVLGLVCAGLGVAALVRWRRE